MKRIMLAVLAVLVMATAAHAWTVTLNCTDPDPAVTQYDFYGAPAPVAGCSALTAATPMIAPWVKLGTTTTCKEVLTYTNSGVECYYVTALNAAGAESPPSNIAPATIPLSAPVLGIPTVGP